MKLQLGLLVTSLALSSAQVTLTGTNTEAATSTIPDYRTSGVTYRDDASTFTITSTGSYGSVTELVSTVGAGNATISGSNGTATANSTSSATQTLLVGSAQTTTTLNGTGVGNTTATATTSAAQPTNTVPCNGFVEFCQRKYSNITHVGAHNSPFVRPGNLASNQELDVTTQLNDGIRMCMFYFWRSTYTSLIAIPSTIPDPL